jgi:hypothetical protein
MLPRILPADPGRTAHDPAPDRKPNGLVLLAAGGCAVVAVWCGLLPWIAAWPHVAGRLAELDAQGIDPSAMYYSELPAMDGVMADLDRIHRADPEAFWIRKPGRDR